MKLYKKLLVVAMLAIPTIGILLPPANADKRAERLDYLPLNTSSFKVKPYSTSALVAPRVTWDYTKQSDGSSTSSATQTFTITGVLATDIAQVTMGEAPSNAGYIKCAVCTADTLTVTLSTAPGNIVSFNINIRRTL